MNPFSAVTWLWRALRGRSVTFAALFALTLTGFSVLGWLQWILRAAGAHWLALLLAPALIVMALARKEAEWVPDEEERRKWARGLVFGAILAAVLAGFLVPEPPAPERPPPAPTRSVGPRGK